MPLKFFDDYKDTYRAMGSADFNRLYRHAVLIGIGIVGDINEEGQRGDAQTFLAQLHHTDGEEGGSLMRRVWLIRKGDYGPPSAGVRIGRDADNDLVIPDYSISKVHCEFQRFEGYMTVTDLGSHNGTIVSGKSLFSHEPHRIANEDEIVLGRYKFEFLDATTFVQRVQVAADSPW